MSPIAECPLGARRCSRPRCTPFLTLTSQQPSPFHSEETQAPTGPRLTPRLTAGWQSQRVSPHCRHPTLTMVCFPGHHGRCVCVHWTPRKQQTWFSHQDTPSAGCRQSLCPRGERYHRAGLGLREGFALRTARQGGQKAQVGARAQPTPFLEEPVMELKEEWNEESREKEQNTCAELGAVGAAGTWGPGR